MKIYSATYSIFHPFKTLYPDAEFIYLPANGRRSLVDHHGPGFLILHGGSDIHPSLYGRPNQGSHVGNAPAPRDQYEAKLFTDAVAVGLPIVGICRGAQLGCALSGGILVQNVDGHGWGSHRIETEGGDTLLTNSIHHQMMYPWAPVDHHLIAWSAIPRSTVYDGLTEEELKAWPKKQFDSGNGPSEGLIEPEIVWFPSTKCLAVQGHPEMLDAHAPLNQFVKGLVDAYCLPS